MTHVLDAEGRIKTYPGNIALDTLADYARGSVITGAAAVWAAYDAKTDGAVMVGDGVDILSTINPTIAGTVTATDFFLPDGGTYGIAGNELLTFNAAGTAVFSGCDVGIGGAVATAAGVVARTTIVGTTTNLLMLSATSLIAKDLHWLDSTSGESWIGSHRTHALGNQLEFWYYNSAAWNTAPNLALTPAGWAGFGLTGPIFNVHATGNNVNTYNVPSMGVSSSTDAFLFLLADAATDNLIAWDSNRDLRFGTGGAAVANPDAAFSEKMRITTGGNVGINVAGPQGRLHGYDAISGFLHWEYDGVDGTARTVILNGAGDVVYVLTVLYAVRVSNGEYAGAEQTVAPGNSITLYSFGGDTCTLAVAADGSVTVQRTAGALTYKVALWLLWI